MSTYFGIDYGSKFTGNTVIATLQDEDVLFLDVGKKTDADQFILNANNHFKPDWIFIDAPLSLPGVYSGVGDMDNYHFRQADLECKAMSPMFLGGLAARAMELKAKLEKTGTQVYETYPQIMAQRLNLPSSGYKTNRSALKACARDVTSKFKSNLNISAKDIKTWHHLDALLALMSAMSYEMNQCEHFGYPAEGVIIV